MDSHRDDSSATHSHDGEDRARITASFGWRDGNGSPWRIEASVNEVTLVGPEGVRVVERDAWEDAIRFAPSGGSMVIHFDLGDREVGFLAPAEEADRLYRTMAGMAEVTAPSPQPVAMEVSAPVYKEGPAWPKMNTGSIVAICLAALAFLPFAGILFAIAALVLAVRCLRAARPNAADLHIRVINRISVLIAVVGAVTCCASTYALVQHGPWSELEILFARFRVYGEEVEWSWGAGIAAIVMIIIALSVHEAAHAITAWWLGDDYARSLGRVTLNPLAHIDPFGTVLLPLMLAYMGWPVFGYAKPVPVRPGVIRQHRRAHILISAAGPVSNLLQAGICLMLLMGLGLLLGGTVSGTQVQNFASFQPMVEIDGIVGGKVLAAVALMLKLGFQINVLLAFFNLIPIPPLDGSWIIENLFPGSLGRVYATIRPYGFLLFIGLLYSGALEYCIAPGLAVVERGQLLVSLATGF